MSGTVDVGSRMSAERLVRRATRTAAAHRALPVVPTARHRPDQVRAAVREDVATAALLAPGNDSRIESAAVRGAHRLASPQDPRRTFRDRRAYGSVPRAQVARVRAVEPFPHSPSGGDDRHERGAP